MAVILGALGCHRQEPIVTLSPALTHLQQVFYAIEPELTGKHGVITNFAGWSNSDKTEWSDLKAEVLFPPEEDGTLVKYLLRYHLTVQGTPTNVILVRTSTSPVGQQIRAQKNIRTDLALPAMAKTAAGTKQDP